MRMNSLHSIIVVSMIMFGRLALAEQPSGGNYEEDLSVERSKLVGQIKYLKSMLVRYGDEGVKYNENRVSFHISDEPIPNAWISRDLGTRQNVIYITPTYRLLITYLADADVISSVDASFLECRQSYVDALFRILAENRTKISNGDAPLRMPAPEIYLETSYKCNKFKTRFPIEQKFRVARDNVVNIVVALAYLHELGHLALGHEVVDLNSLKEFPENQRLSEFVRLMSHSRDQESKADDWAIDRFVDLSDNPVDAFNNVLSTFYLAFGGFDCSMESADSHPNGYQRFSRQMSRMKERAIAKGKFHSNPELTSVLDDMKTLAKSAQLKLHCP